MLVTSRRRPGFVERSDDREALRLGSGFRLRLRALRPSETAAAATLLTFAGAVTAGGNLLFNLLVARTGGTATYGAVGALLSVATVAGVAATGTTYAVARTVARSSMESATAVRRSLVSLVPWVLLAILPLSLTHFAARYLSVPDITVFATLSYALAAIAAGAPLGVLLGMRRYRAVAALTVAACVLRLVWEPVLATWLPVRDAAVAASLAAAICAFGLTVIVALRSRPMAAVPERTAHDTTGMAAGGIVGVLFGIALWVIWTEPLSFARHELSGVAAGKFASVQLMASAILLITAPVTTAFFPRIARTRDAAAVRDGLLVTGSVAAVLVIGLVLAGPWIATQLYGPSYTESWTLFAVWGSCAAITACASYAIWVTRAVATHAVPTAFILAIALVVDVSLGLANAGVLLLATAPAIALVTGATLVAPVTLARRWRAHGRRKQQPAAPATFSHLVVDREADALHGLAPASRTAEA